MKEKLKKIKDNKALKIIGNILYIIFFIIVMLMLIVVIMQRATDNSITFGGFRMFTVATGSMVPEYEVGDVLISKEIEPDEIKVDDDIVYKGKEGSFKDRVVTHRVISIEKEEDGNYKIITKGIANPEQDPEIDQTQVYGKIVYKIKTLSFIGKLISNIYIFYFFIFIPIAIIIFKQIKNIASNDEDEDDEDDEEKKEDGEEKIDKKEE